MLRKSKVAVMALVLMGLALSHMQAASSEYKIAVDVMGPDGSKRASGTFICPIYDRCQNWLPLVVDGKPFKMGVRSYLLDDRHIRVMLQGGGVTIGPFDDVDADRPFESGQEWDAELRKAHFAKASTLYGKAHIRIEN